MNNERKEMVVSFDLDGVLFDFPKAMSDMFGFVPDLNYWSMGVEDFRPLYLEFISNNGFRYGDIMVDANKIALMRSHGIKVVYTTARREEVREATQLWLNDHALRGPLLMSDDKSFPMALYSHQTHNFVGIDDNADNARRMANCGMMSHMVRYGHNAHEQDSHDIWCVDNANEFCDSMLAMVS